MNQFNFLKKYSKFEILQFISSLQAFSENSSHFLRLSVLQKNAMLKCKGNKHLNIYDVSKEIERHYAFDVKTDPQEFMFVELVHTPKGSYKVFTGSLSNQQYNLTRLLYIAKVTNINSRLLNIIYLLLDISDQLATKFGYARYEAGNKESEKIYYPNYKEYTQLTKSLLLTKSELSYLLEKYELNLNDIEGIVYKELENRKKIKECSQDNNLIDYFPLYKINSDYLILQPSSLLCCAFVKCITILANEMGEEKLKKEHFQNTIEEITHTAQNGFGHHLKTVELGDVQNLWFQFDRNKIANIITFYDDSEIDYSNLFESKKNQKLINKVYQVLADSEKNIQTQFPHADYFNLLICNPLGSGLAFLKKQSNLIFASVDEFIMMLGQDEIKLSDIYYYAMDKAKINIGPSQEIDAFAYYLENNQTFYSDRIIYPSFMYYEVGLFHAFRAKYFKKMDKHLIKSSQRFIWVSHLNDFPDSIPIFIPSGISRMKDYLFLELKKCIVTFNVILNIDEDRRFFAAQVAKSLAIWLYIIESKNDVFLTDDLHIGIEIASEGEDPKMFMGYDGCFRLLLPDSFIQSSKMRDNMVEQQLMFILLESLAHFGVISGLNINQYIDKVFSECSGSFLLINKDGIPFLAENDGINSCYFINKRYCDVLLEEIADLINLKGEERKISISDSKNIVLKVLSFLNNKIIKLISSISTHDFLIRLLELHHAQLFWLQTTFSRFEQTNKLYEYLNANDFSQREYLQKYSETNILSQGIIEYLIIHCSKSKKKDAPIDKIEEVFAVMHHIYSFGLYCDLLSASLPNMELIILPNGRLALPKDKIDNFQEYFFDLRDSELYQPEELRTLEELLPEFSVDLDNKQFLSAFFSEYGIAYTSYLEIMNKSFEYANVKNQPIVSIKEEDFKSHIISSILSNDEYIFFKSNFILHSDLKSQIGKNKRFNESEQLIHRYNRRLQLSSRPWVNYDNMISFSSKSLYKSYQIFINRLESGKLNASSKEMISFLSQINALKGKQFNNHLYLLFKKFENTEMSIRKEEPIKPNKVLANDSDLGDIDILLINTVKKKIVCIEAKNYYEGRSAYEIISQAKTTEDNLSKVYRREEWCINNILKFSHIHNAVDESYSLTTVFLTYNQPSYIYFERNSSKIKFISALDIITSPMKIFDL